MDGSARRFVGARGAAGGQSAVWTLRMRVAGGARLDRGDMREFGVGDRETGADRGAMIWGEMRATAGGGASGDAPSGKHRAELCYGRGVGRASGSGIVRLQPGRRVRGANP